MAEAVVEERPALPVRYFCHMCKVEINIPNGDFICPLCAGGFIEELPAARNETSRGSSSSASMGANTSRTRAGDRLNALRDDLTSLLMSRNASNFEISFGDDGSRRISITGGGGNSGGGEDHVGGGGGGTNQNASGNIGGGRVRPRNLDRFDNVLLDFLQTLTLNDADGPFGGSQFIFMGNPGDYAWGREGIDTIVTQLLNQMDTSGPPPLSKEKIDEIPVSKVSADEVKNKVQCSVCWEDFKFDENVRRLPCAHIYHEACIIPWLNLHNTCPICRKSLADANETEQSQAEEQQQQRATGGDGASITVTHSNDPRFPFLASFIQQQQQRASNNRNQPNNSGGANGGSNASQDHVFSFDNSNHNFDMDLD